MMMVSCCPSHRNTALMVHVLDLSPFCFATKQQLPSDLLRQLKRNAQGHLLVLGILNTYEDTQQKQQKGGSVTQNVIRGTSQYNAV